MSSIFSLKDKVAIITGAEGGLGSAAAMCYAYNGAHLALLGLGKEGLDTVKRDVEAETDRKVITIETDVTNEEAVAAAVQQVMDTFGKIDILLNNAGIALSGDVVNLSWADWEKTMNVNLGGVFLMSKAVVPHMQAQQYGKIVNIASINAIVADTTPELFRHAYNASKIGVIGLTRAMAASYGRDNITVNAVGPGLFETNMTKDTLFQHDGFMDAYNHQSPAQRPGREGELSGTLIYLSSDASSYVTGQTIFVDGGMSVV